MVRMFTLLLAALLSTAALAQQVTVSIYGERIQQLRIDGRIFDIDNNLLTQPNRVLRIDYMAPGEHVMQLVRLNDPTALSPDNRPGNRNEDIFFADKIVTNTSFTVRPGFDVAIVVAANASVLVKHNPIRELMGDGLAMSDFMFNQLLEEIQYSWRNTRRIAAAQHAFLNNNNYFTAAQARRIIETISGEANRVALARLAYNRIVDRSNYIKVYELLTSDVGRSELATFLRTEPGAMTFQSYSERFQAPISETLLEAQLQRLNSTLTASARVNVITELITNETQFFTTQQVRRLMEFVEFESQRLQLLKLVYSHITDPDNFHRLYGLLLSDAARIELINHVRTAAENGGLINHNLHRTAMNEDNFRQVYNQALEHQLRGNTTAHLSALFNDIGSYFTAYQAAQLIAMAEGEQARLSMAKAAYRKVVDPQHYLDYVTDLLEYTVSKNELILHAYTYRPV